MITKEWAGIIKNETDPELKKRLPPGPWQDEPDHFFYLDSASGYFGFDYAHARDLIPSDTIPDLENEVYRDFDFVKSEVDSLARQLFEYEKKGEV